MTETITAPAAETPDTTKSDITTPQTATATPDAGKTETGEPTAAPAKTADGEQDTDAEPSQAEIRKRQRNRERWAEMKGKARELESVKAELAKLKAEKDPDWSQYADPNQEVADRVFHTLRKGQISNLENRAEKSRDDIRHMERQSFDDAVADGRSRFPDFDQVVFNPQVLYPKEIVHYVANSERGVDVAYYLGKNAEVATRLFETFEQNPYAGFVELGKIEGALSRPSSKPSSKAPAPAKTISGNSASPAKSPDEMTFAEYEAWRMGKS